MCHKSPGPRCAAHLRVAMNAAREQIEANKTAFANGHEPPHRGAEGRLAQLQDEFDETRTGQADLAGQINALENVDAHEIDIDVLRSRMLNASDRRVAKLAAAKSVENGEPRTARLQLKYGAHAGWLAHTDIVSETSEHGGPTVYRDYAVGTSYRDEHEEQIGYEEHATNLLVADSTHHYEAPVTPGPTPGTWVVGGDVERRHNRLHRIMPVTVAMGPNQGFRKVTPVLYDETSATVAPYDVRTGRPTGAPLPVTDPNALAVLDYNDGMDLGEALDDNRVDALESKVSVVETSDHQFILRGTFEVSRH